MLKYGFRVKKLSTYFNLVEEFIIYIIRCVVAAPTVFATCRDLACTVTMGKISMDLVASTIDHLKQSSIEISYQRRHADKMFKSHLQQEIVVLLFYDIFSNIAACLMGAGFLLNIALNYVTIKLHHVVPMPMYLWFPTVSVLIPILIGILLPMMINVYENSKEAQNEWKWHSSKSSDLKYLQRRLKGTRPLRMQAGIGGYNLYFFKQSTKVTFYTAIIDYTINALLSS